MSGLRESREAGTGGTRKEGPQPPILEREHWLCPVHKGLGRLGGVCSKPWVPYQNAAKWVAPGWGMERQMGLYLPRLLAHQGEQPEVDGALAPGGRGLEVHHEHIGEQAEEGEVGEDVQVEDHHGRGEEGAGTGHGAAYPLQPLLSAAIAVERRQ